MDVKKPLEAECGLTVETSGVLCREQGFCSSRHRTLAKGASLSLSLHIAAKSDRSKSKVAGRTVKLFSILCKSFLAPPDLPNTSRGKALLFVDLLARRFRFEMDLREVELGVKLDCLM